MKVFINGKIKGQGRVEEVITEVVSNVIDRIGVPAGTDMAIEGLEFKVVFTIDGQESYATVPRDVNGETVNEMFMLSVHLDENGNVIGADDNEAESFYDGYTLAKSIGQDYKYESCESKYQNDELEIVESLGENSSDDVMAVKYTVKADSTLEVVRHYKGDLLVAEYEYLQKK